MNDKDDKSINETDKIFMNHMKEQEEVLKREAGKLVTAQLFEMNKDTQGVMIIRFGNENYMVSGRSARKGFDIMKKAFKKKFPGILLLLVPWYYDITTYTMDDFKGVMNKSPTGDVDET